MKNGKCINDRVEVFETFLSYAKHSKNGMPDITVSLETRDGDFENAIATLKSLIKQTIKPQHIILNIPIKDIVKAPEKLFDICEKNKIEIKPCLIDNKELNCICNVNNILILVHSGIKYEAEMISKLLMWNQINPSSIICSKCQRPVYKDGDDFATIALWPIYEENDGSSIDMLIPCFDSVILIPPFLLSDLDKQYLGFKDDLGLYLAYACKLRKSQIMSVYIDSKNTSKHKRSLDEIKNEVARKDQIISEYFNA